MYKGCRTQYTCLPQVLIEDQNFAIFQSAKDFQLILHETCYHCVELQSCPLGKPNIPVGFENQSIVFIVPEVFLGKENFKGLFIEGLFT